MKRRPTARQIASVPPTVVAPTACWIAAAAMSRGPSLRADRSKRSSWAVLSPTCTFAVQHAHRRRDGTAVTGGLLGCEADRDAFAGRETVRYQSRLERDDPATVALRFEDLVGDHDHGIAPSFPQQRAAASRPSSGPPTRKPAASASPAPVASSTVVGSAG